MDKILVKEIIAPICIVLFFSLLYFVLKAIIKKMMRFKFSNVDIKRKKTIVSLIINVIKYFFIIIALLMILSVYGINTSALVASLGVIGLVVGLALQNTLTDFISGLFIIIENQYGIGDVVTISGFKGEVIALGLKTTKIKAYTGEVKIISNRNIEEVINHSVEPSLAVVNVQIAYEDDLEKAEKVIQKLCEEWNQTLPNLKGKVEYLGVTDLAESGIELRLTVSTEATKQYEVERIMKKEIKLAFDQNKITIPYNQVVVHNA